MKKLVLTLIVALLLAMPAYGQRYEETLTTTATSTGAVFKPHDGKFAISIYFNDTGAGTVVIQRRDESTDDWRDVGDGYTADYEGNGEHYGGPNWEYRAFFSTATSGSVTVEMHQR